MDLSAISKIWTIIVESNTFNFIFFALIIVWIFKKINIKAAIASLQQKILEILETAKKTKEEAVNDLMQAEKAVENLGEELKVIVEDAEKSAKVIGEKILTEAQKQLESIESNAEKVIEAEERMLISKLTKSTSKASVDAARSHIQNVLEQTPSLHEKYINDSIDELDRLKFLMASNGNTLIADRYADALVKIAQEGVLTFEKISSDLSLVKDTLSQSKDLNEFLTNPLVSIDDKKEIIDKVFLNEIDNLIVNFLKVLTDKNRFSAFNEIFDSYNKFLDNINNISRIKVISAVALTDESKSRLKIKLEEKLKKNVVLDMDISSDIIAGLVIKIGDNVIDMSMKHKLEDLSKNITR